MVHCLGRANWGALGVFARVSNLYRRNNIGGNGQRVRWFNGDTYRRNFSHSHAACRGSVKLFGLCVVLVRFLRRALMVVMGNGKGVTFNIVLAGGMLIGGFLSFL